VADDALESALRALKHRDRSAHEIDRRLAEQGFGPDEREHVLETLERTGLLDDTRFAGHRAELLAARGAGDELIRHDLSSAGIASEVVDEAIDSLEPEIERARRIVETRGASPKTARFLHGRGYSHDVVAAAVATGEGHGLR
jgi:regulatory protein